MKKRNKKKRNETIKNPCKLINLHGKAFNMDNIKRFLLLFKTVHINNPFNYTGNYLHQRSTTPALQSIFHRDPAFLFPRSYLF